MSVQVSGSGHAGHSGQGVASTAISVGFGVQDTRINPNAHKCNEKIAAIIFTFVL